MIRSFLAMFFVDLPAAALEFFDVGSQHSAVSTGETPLKCTFLSCSEQSFPTKVALK
jgi:hypothetical protein